uniref:Zgc:101858 n=1 Tax=Salmo trutta TaxID=8032 RepID=A0A673YV17_SALTR
MASEEGFKVSSLKGKVTLITGASSGIGAGTSLMFAKLGALLALNGRDVENLTNIAKQCTDLGAAEPLLVPGDLTNEDTVKKTVELTIAHFGRLDVLINSAGILAMGSIETGDLAQYDKVMNVNVRSVYHLTQLCVPHLIRTKGSIVNVSSVNGQRSFPGVLAYCMSKSAIDQFTRCIALGKNYLFFSHSLFILFSVICIIIVGENTGDTHTTHISPRASVEASASELCLVCQVYVLLLNYYLLCSYYDHIDLSLSLLSFSFQSWCDHNRCPQESGAG